MIVLGIESSCDETAAAIVKYSRGRFHILANYVSSQIEIHKPYGGVIPELAARNHIVNIMPLIDQALRKAKLKTSQIDRLAVTVGPGLITSLMVGAQTAKTLAYAWNKQIVPVNHLKGHIYSSWLLNNEVIFPAICLIVSGGHTELILARNRQSLKKIGQTQDDAAGEAFDKVAALLHLGYPGGPIISKLAENGNSDFFNLPRPMIKTNDFNFSFSGLKTAVLYTVKKINKLDQKTKENLAASFQKAVVDVLVAKTIRAQKKYNARTILMAGGVAANKKLRESFSTHLQTSSVKFLVPPIDLCTDNAVIIAAAGVFGKPTVWEKIKIDPNLEIF